MKNFKTFEQFVNESLVTEGGLPAEVKKMAKALKTTASADYDLDDMYVLDVELQANYIEKDNGFGSKGWQIADFDGNELYTGTDFKKALAAIKKVNEGVINEGKEISKSKIDMMGSKILNRIKIGTKFVTDGGDYTVTGFGPKSNAFQEYEAERDGKPCKVKLTAMYGVKLEVTDDPRSAVYRKEERLNSVILESLNETRTKLKTVKTFGEYITINENRFKQGKEMFGYKIEKQRAKLKPEIIEELAKTVQDFTSAYKTVADRDGNIFDLTDAMQEDIAKLDPAYWKSLRWSEETIATRIVDAFRNGLKAQKPSMTAIKAMLSELPLDSGWG